MMHDLLPRKAPSNHLFHDEPVLLNVAAAIYPEERVAATTGVPSSGPAIRGVARRLLSSMVPEHEAPADRWLRATATNAARARLILHRDLPPGVSPRPVTRCGGTCLSIVPGKTEVCAGTVTLAWAQQAISSDWVSALKHGGVP